MALPLSRCLGVQLVRASTRGEESARQGARAGVADGLGAAAGEALQHLQGHRLLVEWRLAPYRCPAR